MDPRWLLLQRLQNQGGIVRYITSTTLLVMLLSVTTVADAQGSFSVGGGAEGDVEAGSEVGGDANADASADMEEPAYDDDMGPGSTPDPIPEVPGTEPKANEAEIKKQAGVGGDIAFAEKGVLELGGAGYVNFNDGGTSVSLRPSVGWFVVNNVELSAIIDFAYANPDGGDSFTTLGALVEPSLHLPFNDRLLWFVGLGAGLAYNDEDVGFAIRPRVGLDVLVGRSGIFRPSLEATFSTAAIQTQNDRALIGVKSSYGASFGYHVMF